MFGLWVDGQRDIHRTDGPQGGDHALGFREDHDAVAGAMERPHGESAESRPALSRRAPRHTIRATAADRHERSEALRPPDPDVPRAVASHAQTGQDDSGRIHAQPRTDVIE